MSDELMAAAERLRKLDGTPPADWSLLPDLAACARAYIAERDETPLTYETYAELCDRYGIISRAWVNGSLHFSGRRLDAYVCRTVGELRTAVRLAGITLNEPTQ